MSDANIELSGSANLDVEDTLIPDFTLSKVKPVINKSPVLYLRRRRNTDFRRGEWGGPEVLSSQWFTSHKGPDSEPAPVDAGDIYPNHGTVGRIGSIEWVKFRDYKRLLPKWIKRLELRIDGE